MQAKYRSRFFALADVFLASGMVPAYTAAAFVKRLARLALAAPPAGALLALAFAHNIVRRHPATMQLLHRPPRGGLAGVAAGAAAAPPPPQPLLPLPPEVAAAQDQQPQQPAAANGAPAGGQQQEGQQAGQQQGPAWRGEDVYDFTEPDPAQSRALESSLWELEALRVHHNPQVGGPGRAPRRRPAFSQPACAHALTGRHYQTERCGAVQATARHLRFSPAAAAPWELKPAAPCAGMPLKVQPFDAWQHCRSVSSARGMRPALCCLGPPPPGCRHCTPAGADCASLAL